MASFNYPKIKAEIHEYCELADINTYNERGILDEVYDLYLNGTDDMDTIDDIDPETWEEIVVKHDTGSYTAIA